MKFQYDRIFEVRSEAGTGYIHMHLRKAHPLDYLGDVVEMNSVAQTDSPKPYATTVSFKAPTEEQIDDIFEKVGIQLVKVVEEEWEIAQALLLGLQC
jgi:hypothetical protein